MDESDPLCSVRIEGLRREKVSSRLRLTHPPDHVWRDCRGDQPELGLRERKLGGDDGDAHVRGGDDADASTDGGAVHQADRHARQRRQLVKHSR